MEHGSDDGDARGARLQPTAVAARIIRPELLPIGYVPVLSTPRVVRHGEAGSLGQFESPALWQAFAPRALVSTLAEDDLWNGHPDEIIVVYVIPLSAVPAAMVDALRRGPVAGPIPDSVPDAMIHHRRLKQLRDDLVVDVAGSFSKEEISVFTEHLEVDAERVKLLPGRTTPGGAR